MSDPKPTSTSDTDENRRVDPAPSNDKTNPENHQDEMSQRLDEALEETFPSSDPVSVKITK
ncbi:hypothetical protein [Methylobacterium sp. Leaf85]|uniref:hypothetical protein n=1 Tax=Methylobacterium sp. Leaf85 TaxID=1736241 RepID=UPI0006FB2598|nr:hypothetical protein [Methylobacterium sp. Leaf85]KQO46036.1 hypothetical protein ASF08_06300 [Methylobacterium sp. Leaf85]